MGAGRKRMDLLVEAFRTGVSLTRTIRYAVRFRNWQELSRIRNSRGHPRSAELRSGLSFRSPDDTNVLRPIASVFFKHVYDPPGFEIGGDDCVVDVGANFGAFSVFAGRRTAGRVIAVEPHPTNVEALRHNLSSNGCDHVEVAALALSDREGFIALYPGRSGTTHQLFADGPDRRDAPPVQVPTTTLGRFLETRDVPRVDLLKMDCEGAEGLIFSAAEDGLDRVRRIAMEYHDASSPKDHGELAELLEKRGFRVRVDSAGGRSNGMMFASRAPD